MDILLIGNGFDIAHHLPTRYENFISFLENAQNSFYLWDRNRIEQLKFAIPDNYCDAKDPDNWRITDWIGIDAIFKETAKRIGDIMLASIGYSNLSTQDMEVIFHGNEFKIYNCILTWFFIHGNRWYDYLQNKRNGSYYAWCDIENEVYQVVEKFTLNKLENIESRFFESLRLDRTWSIDKIRRCLYDEFCQLTDYLEIYLTIFENATKLVVRIINENGSYDAGYRIETIERLNPYAIFSLNYTAIYPILYGRDDVEIYQLHGKIGEHNLVFGTKTVECNSYKNELFINFTKRKQMEEYKLDCQLNKLLNNINDATVYVYGCSISEFDKHIFYPVFASDSVRKVVVYCLRKDETQILENIENMLKSMDCDDEIKFKVRCEVL